MLIRRALWAPLFVLVACSSTSDASGPAPTGSGASGSGASGGSGGSAGAGQGGGGAVIGTGGNGAISTGGGGGLQGCATDNYVGEQLPLDLYVLLDRSASMDEIDPGASVSRWVQVATAIDQFMNLPGSAGLGMGLGFFPVAWSSPPPTDCGIGCAPYDLVCVPGSGCQESLLNSDVPIHSCVGTDYATPIETIATLPGPAIAIRDQMINNGPIQAKTPMAPAMEGALTYLQAHASQNPDHLVGIVLVTDGLPAGCNPNSIDTVSAWAAQGLASAAEIRTFVVGLGAIGTLSNVAAAGGTEFAFSLTQGNDAGTQLLDTLDEIRGSLSCSFKVPDPPPGETLDPNLLNVGFTPNGEEQEVFFRVDSPDQCQGNRAWYYDDPQNPTQIELCSAACSRIRKDLGDVDVVVGCATLVK